MAQARPYVFVIGFNKTATTAIHHFFGRNGFPSIHWDKGRLAKRMFLNVSTGRRTMEGYDDRFRVYTDMMYRDTRVFWLEAQTLFRQLDADYPGAFFLYNTRNMDDWLASRSRHFGKGVGESLMDFYKRYLNTQEESEVVASWRRTRENFEAELRGYFAGRSCFAEFDIDDPDFPHKVAAFVGVPMDASHWDRYNVTPRP